MARFALDFSCVGMGPSERKIRPLVIECLFGDRGDILRSTLVLGMALLALSLFFELSMGTLLGLDVFSHVFVTIETERILRCLVEPFVALGAVFFPFGMACDHLPRH